MSDLGWRPPIILPEDMMATAPSKGLSDDDLLFLELLPEAQETMKARWDFARKECPDLTRDDFHERDEGSIGHPLSNQAWAFKRAGGRDGKSFNKQLFAHVRNGPTTSVNTSRSNGFSWNWKYYIVICIDLDEGFVNWAEYSETC